MKVSGYRFQTEEDNLGGSEGDLLHPDISSFLATTDDSSESQLAEMQPGHGQSSLDIGIHSQSKIIAVI